MDQSLFLAINIGWAHPWLDGVMAWVSHRFFFAFPLLLAYLWVLRKNFAGDGVKLWLMLALVVGSGDALGGVLKEFFAQPRPCAALIGLMHGTPCPGNYKGMPSNHAINFFSAATFLAVTLRGRFYSLWLFAVAVLVSLSRVYLAKHFPSQVLAGAAIGAIWGALWALAGLQYAPFLQRIRARP